MPAMFAPLYEPPELNCALSQTGHPHPFLQHSRELDPVERFGVVDGELSQICLGNFRGSDSAAAIP